ncbi:hypothetical protein QBC44DRAFT_66491 [Cladorrhinum sp. PSN332]|nr:hypothetical protein QBC44DRAFT_66491 [Cladorrhinum sp. PSN332]
MSWQHTNGDYNGARSRGKANHRESGWLSPSHHLHLPPAPTGWHWKHRLHRRSSTQTTTRQFHHWVTSHPLHHALFPVPEAVLPGPLAGLPARESSSQTEVQSDPFTYMTGGPRASYHGSEPAVGGPGRQLSSGSYDIGSSSEDNKGSRREREPERRVSRDKSPPPVKKSSSTAPSSSHRRKTATTMTLLGGAKPVKKKSSK